MSSPLIFLLGPTASGKTALAIELTQRLPCEIISVDSAMVYRGMDIGSAKPSAEELQKAPHRLIDIVDASTPYSAGQFRADALREIKAIQAKGKIPLLVGGTMLYFRVLQQGIATLPKADQEVRQILLHEAQQIGWEGMHARLARIDEQAALRIHQHDSQRIQRALEVYFLTGKTLTMLQAAEHHPLADFHIYPIAIAPPERRIIHDRIAKRFDQMLNLGFVDEVKSFYERDDMSPQLPAMRSVGYRQVWEYLEGQCSYDEMREKAIIATRQFAKRQITWLRSWPQLKWFDSENIGLLEGVRNYLSDTCSAP